MRQIEQLYEMCQRDTDECILWPHFLNSTGYGFVWTGSGSRRVHRLVCIRTYGEPPPDHETAHSCGMRACVNRRHLRWATHLENMQDRTYALGEGVPSHKLTEEHVRAIRHRSSLGAQRAELARAYGVTAQTVLDIVRRRTWSWLQ